MQKNSVKPRYHTIDELRGFAVLCMIVYHGLYTLSYNTDVSFFYTMYKFFTPAQPYFASLFIALSGVACSFSRSNFKRGLKLLIIAVGVTLVTVVMTALGLGNFQIYFGILHLLATGMLLSCVLIPLFKKINISSGIIVSIALFLITYSAESGYIGISPFEISLPDFLYKTNYLFMFGFYKLGFYSADYFPIFPWIFMFFAGIFIGLWERQGKYPEKLKVSRIPFLSFLGKNALIIYIVHQPLTYLLMYVIMGIISL